jgi:hypothetical protein
MPTAAYKNNLGVVLGRPCFVPRERERERERVKKWMAQVIFFSLIFMIFMRAIDYLKRAWVC